MELEAVKVTGHRGLARQWAVRPKGRAGNIGWGPYPWSVVYVTASSEQEAIEKAAFEVLKQIVRSKS